MHAISRLPVSQVVGWGIETDGLLTEELHQALMPVVSPAICIYSYPSFFGVYTNNQTYCAGYSPDQPAAGKPRPCA